MPRTKVTSAHKAVEWAVCNAPDYHDGQFESLQRKFEKLSDIVAFMSNNLPPSAQDELAAQLDCEIVKEPTNG